MANVPSDVTGQAGTAQNGSRGSRDRVDDAVRGAAMIVRSNISSAS